MLFGTDVGAVDDDPGPEYALMADAGMTPVQILTSLTTAPATRFASSGAGRVAVGLPADLVVLDGDPTADIRALTAVRFTLRGGRTVYRSGPSQGGSSPPAE